MKRGLEALAATIALVLPAAASVAGSGMVTPPLTSRFADQFVAAANDSFEGDVYTNIYVRGEEYRSAELTPQGTYVSASEGIYHPDHYTTRTIRCLVDRSSMKVWTNGATLQVILDPQSPNCTQEGWAVDSSNNATPYGFESPVSVQGTWSDPGVVETWISNVSTTNVYQGGVTRSHCKSVRAWEAKGTLIVNGVVYPFGAEVPDTNGDFSHEACNFLNPVRE